MRPPETITTEAAPDDSGDADTAAKTGGRAGSGASARLLRHARLEAEEIVDIGVRAGTPFLYKTFPEARFLLVDPQTTRPDQLVSEPADYEILAVAVGSAPGRMPMNIDVVPGKSGLLERTALTRGETEAILEVEMTTLDAILRERCRSDRIGIKLDVEGYEMEALKGLVSETHRVAFLIVETSVKARFVDGYQFSELVAALLDKGFLFFNFLNPVRDNPKFYDCLFLPRGDPRFR